MKTKNNTFKRIAAGALAAISVASYTMPANVGGVLVNSLNASLVAQAAEKQTVNLGDVSKYITSFSDGTSTFDNAALSGMTDYAVAEGKTVTIKSSIPLTFKKYISKETAFGIVDNNKNKVIADDNRVYEKTTGTVKQTFVQKDTNDNFQLAKAGDNNVPKLEGWENAESANVFNGYSVYPAGKTLEIMSQFGDSAVEKVIAYEDSKGELVAEDRLLDLGAEAQAALKDGDQAFKTVESVNIADAFTKANVLKEGVDGYTAYSVKKEEVEGGGADTYKKEEATEIPDELKTGESFYIFKNDARFTDTSTEPIQTKVDVNCFAAYAPDLSNWIQPNDGYCDIYNLEVDKSTQSAFNNVNSNMINAYYPIEFTSKFVDTINGTDVVNFTWDEICNNLYVVNNVTKKFEKASGNFSQNARYFLKAKDVYGAYTSASEIYDNLGDNEKSDPDNPDVQAYNNAKKLYEASYTTKFKATGDYTLLDAEGALAVLKDGSEPVSQISLKKDTVVDEENLLKFAAQYGIKTKTEDSVVKFDYDGEGNLQADTAEGATTNKLYPEGTVGMKKAADNTLVFVTPFEIEVTEGSDNKNEAEFEATKLLVTAPETGTSVITSEITSEPKVTKYSTKKFVKNGNECEIADVIQAEYTLDDNTKTLIEFDEEGNAKFVEKINTAYDADAKSVIEVDNIYKVMLAPVDGHKADDMFVRGKEFYYDELSQEGNTPDVTLKMSGNTYVYTYKVAGDGLVKLSGKASNVTITNGLSGNTGNNRWGSDSENATVTDKLLAVDDLTFISDLTGITGKAAVKYDDTLVEAYQSENVVLASSHFFKIRVWDGQLKTAYKEYATKYNAENGRWEATFPVFNETDKITGTQVLVEKADPVYNYTTEGSVLKVTGSGIDQEAAYIRAYGVPAADTATQKVKPETDDEKKKYEMTSGTSLAFGSKVYVDIGRVEEFANGTNAADAHATLKITRNGKEIKAFGEDNVPYEEGTTAYNDENTVFEFDADKTGEYEITYTVFINSNKNTSVAKELKYKFTIDAPAKLTAKDVRVKFSTFEPTLITGAVFNEDTGKWEKVITGADNIKLYVDVDDLKNKSIDVSAQLINPKPEDEDEDDAIIAATVSGATTVNELNLSQPIYVTYNDERFSTGPETIVINWIALSKSKEFKLCEVDGETPLYNESAPNNFSLDVSVDEIEDIQNIVEGNYVLKNGDHKKISYEYSVGKGDKLESHELDWHEAGFPKEIGDYSLYILYDNEPLAIIDLNVIEHGLHAAPTEDQLSITYGDKVFSAEDLAYADADGKAVADAKVNNPTVKIYKAIQLSDAQAKQITDGKYGDKPVYEKDGKFYIIDKNDTIFDEDKEMYVQKTYSTADLLSAGAYIVEVSSNAGTTVGKEGYTLLNDKFVLNVAKKKITADMITIAPQKYKNGAEIKIEQGKITGTDAAVAKNFTGANPRVLLKVASGQQTGKEIGAYTVNVTVDDNEQNYEGTVKNFKWYIIKAAEDDGENFSGIFWNDAETTIVDNGNINVEFGKDANLKGDVVEFGFIGDKSGKIGAPAGIYKDNKTNGTFNYSSNFDNAGKPKDGADANVQAAYSELVYGAGITPAKQNAAMIAKKGKDTFGVSVRIEDANTGVWVRPYLILKIDGVEKLYYGEVRYLNLVEEATDMLNLRASEIGDSGAIGEAAQKAITKDEAKAGHKDNTDLAYMDEARSGYRADKNQFYAYAHYNFDKNSKVRDSAIQGFGVVLDKNGYIPAAEYNVDGEINTESEAYKKAKEVLIPANKGKNGILSGLSKDNPKMLKNEMGVAVNPKDAVTGVWLRSFVDFGNGLIVYTDPVYIKSVSEQYAACKPTVECVKNPNAAKIDYTVKATGVVPTFNNKAATIKEAGLVVDKNGTLFKLNSEGVSEGFVDDATTKLIAENAKTYGYNKGKSTIDAIPSDNVIFKGHALQVTDKSGNYYKTVARPFVVYTINGIDVTIYGKLTSDVAGTVPTAAQN